MGLGFRVLGFRVRSLRFRLLPSKCIRAMVQDATRVASMDESSFKTRSADAGCRSRLPSKLLCPSISGALKSERPQSKP